MRPVRNLSGGCVNRATPREATTTMTIQQMKRKLLQCYFICHIPETRATTGLTNPRSADDRQDCTGGNSSTSVAFKMGSMSIVHSGWLQKMPHASHTFSKCRKRWFVLRSTKDERYVLEYFNEPSSTKAKGWFVCNTSTFVDYIVIRDTTHVSMICCK